MPETVRAIGDTLRCERVRRGLTPKEAADATNLPEGTVVGLEAATLPLDDVPTRASLRIYARSLGVDSEALLRRLEGGDRSAPPHRVPAGADGTAPPTGPPTVAALKARPEWPALLGVALLAAVLGVGGVLWWGSDRTEDSTVALTVPAPTREGTDADGAGADPADRDTPGDAAAGAATGPSTSQGGPAESVEVLPSVRPPEETRIQLLHNGLAPSALAEVTETLEALGYPVVAVNSARKPFRRTTVFFVDGWQPEAEALRARDSRFAQVAPNQDFTDTVPLHIAVGADWGTTASAQLMRSEAIWSRRVRSPGPYNQTGGRRTCRCPRPGVGMAGQALCRRQQRGGAAHVKAPLDGGGAVGAGLASHSRRRACARASRRAGTSGGRRGDVVVKACRGVGGHRLSLLGEAVELAQAAGGLAGLPDAQLAVAQLAGGLGQARQRGGRLGLALGLPPAELQLPLALRLVRWQTRVVRGGRLRPLA